MIARSRPLGRLFKLLCAALLLLVFGGPFYIVALYSVKSKAEMALSHLAPPELIHWENFAVGLEVSNFGLALKNSLITTLFTVAILTLVCAPAAYILDRKRTKFYNAMYYLLLSSVIIPFQSFMTPLYVNLKAWGLINSHMGYILTKTGTQIAFTVLIVTGFVKSIPREMEQSAAIDGATLYGAYWRIVFPLMRPIIFTAIILNLLNVWNDFQISVVILQNMATRTVPLTQYYFMSEKAVELHLAFAVFLVSMIPVIAVYLIFQKYIVQGITVGAIKG